MSQLIGDNENLPVQSTRWLGLFRDGRRTSEEERRKFVTWAASSERATSQVISDMALDALMIEGRPWGRQTREQRIERARRALARGEGLDTASSPASEMMSGLQGFPGVQPGRYASAPSYRGTYLALIAAVLVGATFLTPYVSSPPVSWKSHVAGVAAAAELKLEDGTLVRLSASTRIETQFTDSERRIRMFNGGAEFIVNRDPGRRFIVSTPRGSITARGTAFKVTFNEHRVDVDVSEGRVSLAGIQRGGAVSDLVAGQRGGLSANGVYVFENPVGVSPAAVAGAANQVFRSATLAEIADAFNEKSAAPVFEVRGSACSRVVGAALDLNDPQKFVNRVASSAGLVVERRGEVTVIRGSNDVGKADVACENGR